MFPSEAQPRKQFCSRQSATAGSANESCSLKQGLFSAFFTSSERSFEDLFNDVKHWAWRSCSIKNFTTEPNAVATAAQMHARAAMVSDVRFLKLHERLKVCCVPLERSFQDLSTGVEYLV
jgi:hypothetical protein